MNLLVDYVFVGEVIFLLSFINCRRGWGEMLVDYVSVGEFIEKCVVWF